LAKTNNVKPQRKEAAHVASFLFAYGDDPALLFAFFERWLLDRVLAHHSALCFHNGGFTRGSSAIA
jgi:hypothetical protein